MKKNRILLSITIVLLTAVVLYGQEPVTAGSLFREGQRLLGEGQPEEALAKFEQSAELDDEQIATFTYIGNIAILLERYDKAETAFRKAIELEPDKGSGYSDLCRALSLQKKHDDALRACDEGVRLAPDSDVAVSTRIGAMEAAGVRPEELRNLLEMAVGRFRSSELLLVQASHFYIRSRNYQSAVGLLEQLAALRPELSVHHGMLAEVYLYLGRDADSLNSARTALRLEPMNPYANFALGLIFFELGQHEEAIGAFAKVQSTDPRLRQAGMYQAISEARRGRHREAIRLLQPLSEQDTADLEVLINLGQSLSSLRRYEEAETVYKRATEQAPDRPDLFVALGLAYMMRAEFKDAIENFSTASELRPGDPNIEMLLNVSRARQRLVNQIPDIIKEAETNSSDPRKLLDVIRTLSFLNQGKAAQKYIGQFYALNPDDPAMFQLLGVSLAESGMKREAIDAYKASNEKQENGAAYFGLAGEYIALGENQLATDAFEKGLELRPNSPNFMMLYANLLRDNGKRSEALEMYRRSLSLQPNNPVALLNAGILSLKLGQREAAASYLESLRQLDRNLAKILQKCLDLRLWDQ